MKKYLFLMLLLFIPFMVRAATNDVVIKSVTITDTSGNASEMSKANINNNTISLDLDMNKVGDSITYKVVVQNNSKEDYEINNNINTKSKYIVYSFINDSSIIKNNSTKEIYLKAEYKNEVPSTALNNGSFNESEDISLSVSTITNPKTGFIIPTVLVIIGIVGFMCYMILNKAFKPQMFGVLIGLVLLIPITTFAASKFNIAFKIKVQISKIAMFERGEFFNYKINRLSNNITSFKRSDTLPNDIKTLADSQLSQVSGISVSSEDVDRAFNYIANNNVVNITYKEENGIKYYCYSGSNQELNCESETEIRETMKELYYYYPFVDNYEPVRLNGQSDIKYVSYNYINDSLDVLTEAQVKKNIESILFEYEKANLLKNIISSDNSDYLIYIWEDLNNPESGNIYYYTEAKDVYLNTNSSKMFSDLGPLENISGLSNVNTSKVKNMDFMFENAITNGMIPNIENWNTSNVTSMMGMFKGYNNSSDGTTNLTFDLDLSSWNVSNVVSLDNMFVNTAMDAETFKLNLSGWKTGNVYFMGGLFAKAGEGARNLNIIGLNNWDTSKVKIMSSMFHNTGKNAASWSIGDLSNWKTSNVKSMANMFEGAGKVATTWNIGNISKWNTSKVKNMDFMFRDAAQKASTINLDLHDWDTSKVEHTQQMFDEFGQEANTINLNISGWTIIKDKSGTSMLMDLGNDAKTINLNMSKINYPELQAFANNDFGFGENSENISVDISNLKAPKVTSIERMFESFGNKANTLSINVSDWNMPNVENMIRAFAYSGSRATSYTITGLSTWNTSKVTDMKFMFDSAGLQATTWSIGNLSSWNVSNVTDMECMFAFAGQNASSWSIGQLSTWDTSKVTTMRYMFHLAGMSSTTWDSIGKLEVYATNTQDMFDSVTKAKVTLNIHNSPTTYSGMFNGAATKEGSLITVNYTSAVTNIDDIMATANSNSNVVKGSVIQ